MNKTITFGEIMLRLKPPSHERLFQSPVLEATFGGGEANVAVSLSMFGNDAYFVTALPDSPIGESAERELKKYGVNTSFIAKTRGRLGIYFLETGSCQRPSLVVYDRDESCIAKANIKTFDWELIFNNAHWFHITGITPSLSQCAADTSLFAVKEAKKRSLVVSIDLNYRKKLWNYGKTAPEVMRALTSFADVIIANEEDIQKCLGISAQGVDVTRGHLDIDDYKKLTDQVKKEFPNISAVAVTLRESISADKNNWSAVLSGRNGFYVSKKYSMEDIEDRVGGGDSFSAGLIYGLQEYKEDEQTALEFAAAASCLKHSISGDFNLTRKSEVLSLMQGDGSGRVQR